MKVDKKALRKSVNAAAASFADVADGKNADDIPVPVSVPSRCFGVAVVLTDGTTFEAGDRLHKLGLPGQSGVSGGILAAAPGKLATGAFSSPLGEFGQRIRGPLAAQALCEQLGAGRLRREDLIAGGRPMLARDWNRCGGAGFFARAPDVPGARLRRRPVPSNRAAEDAKAQSADGIAWHRVPADGWCADFPAVSTSSAEGAAR